MAIPIFPTNLLETLSNRVSPFCSRNESSYKFKTLGKIKDWSAKDKDLTKDKILSKFKELNITYTEANDVQTFVLPKNWKVETSSAQVELFKEYTVIFRDNNDQKRFSIQNLLLLNATNIEFN